MIHIRLRTVLQWYIFKRNSPSSHVTNLEKHNHAFCPTFSNFPYSSSFLLHWLWPSLFRPCTLTFVLVESIWEHFVQYAHPTALGFQDPWIIFYLYIGFNVCLPIIFAVIWIIQVVIRIIQVAIPVKPIFSVRNSFRCTILITFGWMTVDFLYLENIYYLSLSSREILCRQSLWQRRSFWQFKCCRTILLKEWPGCFDDLFSTWNASYSCQLLVLCARFLLSCSFVSAVLPQLQTVVELGHSMKCSFLPLSLHF